MKKKTEKTSIISETKIQISIQVKQRQEIEKLLRTKLGKCHRKDTKKKSKKIKISSNVRKQCK